MENLVYDYFDQLRSYENTSDNESDSEFDSDENQHCNGSNSVWHHALLGFYFRQSRRHQTCLKYQKKCKFFYYPVQNCQVLRRLKTPD